MDDSGEWEESTLFSPSKARLHQAQAKDWAAVDSWLSKRYGSKRLPPFERNEETLQALLALATFNDNADEQRSLIERVEKAASLAHSKRASNKDEMYQLLRSKVGKHESFEKLAESVVCLNSPETDMLAVTSAATDLTSKKFTAEQQLQTAEYQLGALKSEQDKILKLINDLKQDSLQPPPDLPEQTADWGRSAKHLKSKISEYDDRLGSMRSFQPSADQIGQIQHQLKTLKEQRARLNELDAELRAFQSLPSNAKAAQAKVENARGDLLDLTKQRDQLFEGLAEAG